MADQLQLRRGTTAQIATFTGAQGEIVVDTDKDTLVVQDGATVGGFPLATEADVVDGTFYYNDDISGGSIANSYILAPKANTNTPTVYMDGQQFGFVTTNANTGPATATFSGLGVRNLKWPGGIDPIAGEISGRVYLIFDMANNWFEIQDTKQYLDTVRIDVSSTANINLSVVAPDTRHINITGTTTITGFTVEAGKCYFVRFADAITLTNNAGIVTNRGGNIAVQAGDSCIIRATAINTVEVICGSFSSERVPGSWSDVLGSRSSGVTYTNTSGEDRHVAVTQQGGASTTLTVVVGGVTLFPHTASTSSTRASLFFTVPSGAQYSVTAVGAVLVAWSER